MAPSTCVKSSSLFNSARLCCRSCQATNAWRTLGTRIGRLLQISKRSWLISGRKVTKTFLHAISTLWVEFSIIGSCYFSPGFSRTMLRMSWPEMGTREASTLSRYNHYQFVHSKFFQPKRIGVIVYAHHVVQLGQVTMKVWSRESGLLRIVNSYQNHHDEQV